MIHGWRRSPALGISDASLSAARLTRSPTQGRKRNTQIVCGLKKKFKPKAKPKSSPALQQEAPAAATPAPRRIDPQTASQYGIKRFKRWVQQNRQAGAIATPVVKQTFRKPRLEADELRLHRERQEEEARKARTQKYRESASFISLYGTQGEKQPPLLLVDGYNVLGKMAGFGCESEDESDIAAAFALDSRERLERRLVEYSHVRQVKVVLVFDAMGGETRRVRRTTNAGDIDVVFTGDSEADTWIMLEVTRLKAVGTPLIIVATSDSDLRSSVSSASFVSSDALLREITKAERQIEKDLREMQYQNMFARTGIAGSARQDVYEQLEQWRSGMN